MATDFLGNKLAVGDEVVFLNYNGTSADLEKGIITKIFSEQAEINGRKRRAEYKIIKLPTIDAEPVRHGRWIKRYDGIFDCSSCGVRMDLAGTPEEYLMHYCPNCGAKMDEVSE